MRALRLHVQEMPREQKLALLGLQFQGLAPGELVAALDGESGSLEAAAALLQFYAEEVLLPAPTRVMNMCLNFLRAQIPCDIGLPISPVMSLKLSLIMSPCAACHGLNCSPVNWFYSAELSARCALVC